MSKISIDPSSELIFSVANTVISSRARLTSWPSGKCVRLYDAAILTLCYTQHAFWPYIDSKINHISHLSKFNLSTKGLNSLTYPVYLKINLLSLLFLLILKIRNPLSFVISIINLFVELFLTITN